MFVIHPKNEAPWTSSYAGMAWDAAGIRNYYKETYPDRDSAEHFLGDLDMYNPVGFMVSEIADVREPLTSAELIALIQKLDPAGTARITMNGNNGFRFVTEVTEFGQDVIVID